MVKSGRLIVGAALLLAAVGCKKKDAGGEQEDWGQHASVVWDASGTPHVAVYYAAHEVDADRRETVGALMYGKGKVSGDSARFDLGVIDGDVRQEGGANAGQYTSLALDSAGRPHISYYDKTNGDLKYAHYDGNWKIEVVDSPGDVGKGTSLVLAADGTPRIAYYDVDNGAVKLAWRNGDQWQIGVVDAGAEGADVGRWLSLAVDGSDNLFLAYYDATNGDLLFAEASGTSFGGTPVIIDAPGDVGRWPSLVLQDGQPRLTYEDFGNHQLKYAQRNAGTWTSEVVDNGRFVGADSMLVIDGEGHPHVAYFDGFNNDLKYATHDGNAWSTQVIAGEGGNGYFNNLFIAADGARHFAFYSFKDTNLNYVVVR